MRFLLPTCALFWACFLAPVTLFASSIIPFSNLGDASTNSDAVVLARAVEALETTEYGSGYQDTKFESIESAKGPLFAGSTFTLRPFSHQTGTYRVDIAGDFKPEIGKTYLLFLNQKGTHWKPVLLSYYVFEQVQEGPEALLVPINAGGLEVFTRPDGQTVEPLRAYHQQMLLQQLSHFATDPQLIWDKNLGHTLSQNSNPTASDRAVPTGCNFTLGGANLARWQNAVIPIFYNDTSIPANWVTTFGNVIAALNNNYTGIDPSNAGDVSYTPNCTGGSAIGGNFLGFCNASLGGSQCALIIFGDPCNEIDDLMACGGVLAFGGSYSTGPAHTFDGQNWDNAIYGFLVVNNGTPGCLTDLEFEQMMTHELTHVYRMGHLDDVAYPDQNMNEFCCNAINTKDIECMNYAYPAAAPVELLSFEAKLQGDRQVALKWVTESELNNAYFTVHRADNSIQYVPIQQVPSTGSAQGGTYEWLDTRPVPGVNYYRLSQTDFDGTVQNLGIKAVKVGKSAQVLSIQPNPIQGETIFFSLEVANDFVGQLEILDIHGQILHAHQILVEKGLHRMQQTAPDLPAGIYVLRLSDGRQQWSVRFLKS